MTKTSLSNSKNWKLQNWCPLPRKIMSKCNAMQTSSKNKLNLSMRVSLSCSKSSLFLIRAEPWSKINRALCNVISLGKRIWTHRRPLTWRLMKVNLKDWLSRKISIQLERLELGQPAKALIQEKIKAKLLNTPNKTFRSLIKLNLFLLLELCLGSKNSFKEKYGLSQGKTLKVLFGVKSSWMPIYWKKKSKLMKKQKIKLWTLTSKRNLWMRLKYCKRSL